MKTLEEAIAAIEQMKADHEAEKAAILSKNKELVEREKAAKRAADDATEAAEAAAEAAAAKAGDVDAIRAGLEKKHKAELDKLASANTKLTDELSTLKIDHVIADAIASHGVLPHHADILRTFLKTGAEMKDGEAYHGDKPLTEHLSGWFGSDAAKHYIAAPVNSGAGAPGSTSAAKSIPLNGRPKNAEEWKIFHALPDEQKASIAAKF